MSEPLEDDRIRLVESGVEQLPLTVSRVLRHLDKDVIDSIVGVISESIEVHGTRFAAAEAYIVEESLDGEEEYPGRVVHRAKGELASAYLLEYPGKLASLVGPWMDRQTHGTYSLEAATRVIRSLIQMAERWEVELVQAVIETDSPFSSVPLSNAGLVRLSTLYQMVFDYSNHDATASRELTDEGKILQRDSAANEPLHWTRYREEDKEVWVEWMDATYEQTADCPELNGLRTTSRTLEGYMATSGADLENVDGLEWWAVFEGKPSSLAASKAGSHIVTAYMLSHNGDGGWELSYMGVAPKYRGRGLGVQTLRRAIMRGQNLNAKTLTLAVDSRNSYAIRIYQSHGFQFLRQLEAWFIARS